MNNNTSLNLNLTDYTIKKIQMEYHNFAYTGKISTNDLTDSFIEKNKIISFGLTDEDVYFITDENLEMDIPEKDFNKFAFYEVEKIDLNKEIPSQAIIKTEVENQDIQNITVIKNTDLKPNLSPKKEHLYKLAKEVGFLPVARKLLKNEKNGIDENGRYVCFDCFNPVHKEGGALRHYLNSVGFKCFGSECNIKGSNNVELVKQVLKVNEEDAYLWIYENFQDYSNSNDSQTSKQSDKKPKDFKSREIIKTTENNKKYRFIAFDKDEIDKKKITQKIIDLIRSELNKSYSIKTFENLNGTVFVGKPKDKKYTSLRIFAKYGNIIINNNSNVTFICEGLTDFLTTVELYKDNFQDYNFIQRHNVKSKIDFNLTDINIFLIDADDNETHIKELIQESKQDTTGKKIYIVEFKQDNIKDLSDYHFKMNFDSNKTKEYIEKNKKELMIIPQIAASLNDEILENTSSSNGIFFDTSVVFNKEGNNYLEYFNSFCYHLPGAIFMTRSKKFDEKENKFIVYFRYSNYDTLIKDTSHLKVKEFKDNKFVGFKSAFKKWSEEENHNMITDVIISNKKNANISNGVLNVFSGYSFKAVPGDITIFKNYMFEILCNSEIVKMNFLEQWITNVLNFVKMDKMLILNGGQGVGKSFFPKTIIKIMSDSITQTVTNSDMIVGNFNSVLSNKALILLEETYLAKNQSQVDSFKHLITGDTINITLKGKEPISVTNYTNFISCNNHTDYKGIDNDDRRHIIFEVNAKQKGNKKYFGNLQNWLDSGGYSHILHYYINRETNKFIEFEGINKELYQQKINNLTAEAYFIYDIIVENEGNFEHIFIDSFEEKPLISQLSGKIQKSEIYSIYKNFCKFNNRKTSDERYFWKQVNEILGKTYIELKITRNTANGKRYFEIEIDEIKARFNNWLSGQKNQ